MREGKDAPVPAVKLSTKKVVDIAVDVSFSSEKRSPTNERKQQVQPPLPMPRQPDKRHTERVSERASARARERERERESARVAHLPKISSVPFDFHPGEP